MKKIVLLLFISLSCIAGAFAQVPLVSLVGMEGNDVREGKVAVVVTTRDEIIKSGRLTGNDKNCIIKGYTFSIVAGSKTWSKHVKGDKLTQAIIKKIKATNGPGVKIYFDTIDIVYDGEKASANPLILTYDE